MPILFASQIKSDLFSTCFTNLNFTQNSGDNCGRRAWAVQLSVGGDPGAKVAAVALHAARRPRPDRHMLPAPLAPLRTHKTRALTSVYAPRSTRLKKKRARSMLDELPVKPGLSPFHPLPAIGQRKSNKETKVYVLDLNDTETSRPATVDDRSIVLKPLTPLRIHGYERTRCGSMERIHNSRRPQQLLRENTYDVIEPIVLKSRVKREPLPTQKIANDTENEKIVDKTSKISPRARFRKAALEVAKLTSVPETGKLLCLREKESFKFSTDDDEDIYQIEKCAGSPTQKLNRLSELFQNLEMKGHHRDKVKKENSWF